MELRAFNCALMILLGLCVVVGCTPPEGRPQVETVDVSGKVTLDGEPVEGIQVRMSSSLDHQGIGVTGSDGTYKLGNGAQPGENKVSFVKVDSLDEDDEEAEAEGDEMDGDETEGDEEAPAAEEGGLPAKYGDAETSETTFTVPAGGATDANFELTTK